MKRLFVLLSLIALVVSCTVSKRTSKLIVPPMAVPGQATIDLAAYEEKYGDYDGVYLYDETTIEHYGGKELLAGGWKFVRMNREKYIIFDPSASRLTTFRTRNKPEGMYVRVTHPDGTVENFTKSDLKKENDLYGYDTYVIILPNIVKGSIVESGRENIYSVSYFLPPLEYDIPLQFTIPAERIDFTFSYPDWWTIGIKDISPNRKPPVDSTFDPTKKKRVLSYHARNVSGLTSEPWAPPFKKIAKYLTFQVNSLKMNGFDWSRPTDWQVAAGKVNKTLFGKRRKGLKSVDALIKRLVDTTMSKYDRMVAITNWVRDSIEVGGKGHDGHNGAIIKAGKGNVLDITSLTRKLLAHAGLKSWLIVAHSADQGYFDEKYVSFDELSSLGVRTIVDSVDYVLFPYIKKLPANQIPPVFQGQRAMLMTGKGASFWTIPLNESMENKVVMDYTVTLDEQGLSHIVQKASFHGMEALSVRWEMEDKDDDEWRAMLQEEIIAIEGDPILDSFKVINEDAPYLPLEVHLFYKVDQLLTVMPDEVIFQTNGLFAPFANIQYRIDPTERKNPVSIEYDQSSNKNIRITYPDQWVLATELADISYSNLFGSASGKYEIVNNSLMVEMITQLHRRQEPKERYADLLDLTGETAKLNIPTLVFSIDLSQSTEAVDSER